jgi:phage I-like protein
VNDTDKDLEELIKDVYRLSGVFGAMALRKLLLGYAATAVPAQLSARSASSVGTGAGAVTLSAEDLAMCKRTGLSEADVLNAKAKAIADGVFPMAAG